MPLPLVLLPLLAQVGPSGTQMQAPLDMPRRKPIEVSLPQTRMQQCLGLVKSAPLDAVDTAEAWRDSVKGSARTEPEKCLGLALARLQQWDDAEKAFAAAAGNAAANEREVKARLGAMAGNAALAAGNPERALAYLDAAHSDAIGSSDGGLIGDVALDRARALVALKRDGDAAASLLEAREKTPMSAQAWLLSATLSRRQGRLDEAQAQIVRAAEIEPVDPEIGLEAGVIAVLAGRQDAARKSWQSVIAAAPGSETAKTAKSYLDQLGPDTAPKAQ